MNAGDALVVAGAGAAVLACAFAALAPRWPAFVQASRRALVGSAVALGLATVWLALHFLAGWTDVAYVWEHTWTGYPWWYRLAGVWGGQKGTILLWAAFLAVASVVEDRLAARAGVSARTAAVARAALAALVAALAGLAAADATFAPTRPDLLALAPAGQGLVEV
ncbi:MAG TPA: hypothetical protein VI997_04765, partial [Candidatus Thermoplasmatota archaeon]|nr:hypothetical protein [Candidatus Thermoplasmatota archaeon]